MQKREEVSSTLPKYSHFCQKATAAVSAEEKDKRRYGKGSREGGRQKYLAEARRAPKFPEHWTISAAPVPSHPPPLLLFYTDGGFAKEIVQTRRPFLSWTSNAS